MTIILDLDDVLANLRECLYQTFHRATGIDRHWQDWPHYDLTQHFSLDKPTLEALLVSERVLENCLPEDGAARAVGELRSLGYHAAIVTARGWRDDAYAVTADWLDRHGVGYDSLSIVDLGGNKLDAIGGFDDVRVAVDDHPSNIRRYSEAGIPSLMIDRPWNRDVEFEHAARVRSLDELLDHARRLALAGS